MHDDIDYNAPHDWELVENPWALDHDTCDPAAQEAL